MTAQQLYERVYANSAAWHETEDPQERQRLHKENVELYGKLDGLTGQSSSFDSTTGRWSSTAAGEGNYVGTAAPEAEDLSDLVEARQKAATRQALVNLEQAYNDGVSALKAERESIGGSYQAARNLVAAQNEIEKHNANTYAAGRGLTDGAAGQIALSQSVAAQNDLNTLTGQEAAAYAENTRALSEMERDYNFAVAQAESEGDYALAQALYDEQSRFSEAQRQAWRDSEEENQAVYKLNRDNRRYTQEQAENQSQEAYDRVWKERSWNYQVEQDKLDRQEAAEQTAWERARLSANDQWERQQDLANRAIAQQNANTSAYNAQTSRVNTRLRVAQEMADVGNFEGFGALGYSESQIRSMEEMWRQLMAAK